MKKTLILVLFVLVSITAAAKKVKFAVDMTGVEVSPNGVHVAGDFQTLAGFPDGDWSPHTTRLFKEGSSDIYSLVVTIPAFQKYEYRFVNGDQFYETEFVPAESRVGHDFNDNRWIYVDSTANDTTFVGAILFGENAPVGKYLIRFQLNMQHMPNVPPMGVHLAGSFQNWNAPYIKLYSFGNDLYEIIAYVNQGTYQYKFLNGNSLGVAETVPATCATAGNRQVVVNDHTVLSPVCFASCANCTPVLVNEYFSSANIHVSPNPVNNFLQISVENGIDISYAIFNLFGKRIVDETKLSTSYTSINISDYPSGMYVIQFSGGNNRFALKFVKK